MQPIATDGAAWAVSWSITKITIVSPEKTTEPIKMPFGMWTSVGPRNHILDGVQIPTREGAVLRAKRTQPRTCADMSDGRHTQSDSAGGSTNLVQMSIWVNIGAAWRIQLNHPCAVVTEPFVKLLESLIVIRLHCNTT